MKSAALPGAMSFTRGQVLRPIHEDVEELVEPEQDGRDAEADPEDRERLEARVAPGALDRLGARALRRRRAAVDIEVSSLKTIALVGTIDRRPPFVNYFGVRLGGMSKRGDEIGRVAVLDDPLRRRLYEFVRLRGSRSAGTARAADIGRTSRPITSTSSPTRASSTTSYARPEGRSGPGAGRPSKLYEPAAEEGGIGSGAGLRVRRRPVRLGGSRAGASATRRGAAAGSWAPRRAAAR